MKKNVNLSLASLGFVALTLGSCSESPLVEDVNNSASVIERSINIVDSEGNVVSSFSNDGGTYYVNIRTDGDWKLATDDEFVCLGQTEGNGSALVPFTLYNNWYGARDFSIKSNIETASAALTRATTQGTTTVTGKQESSDAEIESIKKRISSNLGAGYTVVPRADGNVALSMGIQILNIGKLEANPVAADTSVLIVDEHFDKNEQYYLSSSSTEELHKSVTVGVKASISSGGLSGKGNVGVGVDNKESSTKKYAVKRMMRQMWSREINYENALAQDTVNYSYLTPGFRLVRNNVIQGIRTALAKNDTTKANSICKQFISNYGVGYIQKSLIGCSLDYYIGVEKSDLTEGLSVKVVLDGKYSSQVKSDSSSKKTTEGGTTVTGDIDVDVQNKLNKAVNNSETQVVIYGGNTDSVCVLTSGGELSDKVIDTWRATINPQNAVLVDMEVRPISILFVDKNDVYEYFNEYLEKNQVQSSVELEEVKKD